MLLLESKLNSTLNPTISPTTFTNNNMATDIDKNVSNNEMVELDICSYGQYKLNSHNRQTNYCGSAS